jgi:predicted RND superfamily exporter protein
MMERLSTIVVRLRVPLFVGVVLVSLAAAYLASTLKLYDDPNRWPPGDDPAVVLNDEMQRQFGGANLVTIMISRKDGETIVQPETLAKVKRITDQLMEVHGVIPYAVRSLATINARYLKGTDDVLDASILFDDPNQAPSTPEELERVEFGIENNAALRSLLVAAAKEDPEEGVLVAPQASPAAAIKSPPLRSTIIQADFRTGLQDVRKGLELPVTDPIAIYRDVKAIIEPENDETHTVTAAGSPILIGWVNSDGLPYIFWAFVLVVAGILVVLVFAFRSEVGVLPPLLVGILASVWAFGAQRVIEGDVLTSSSALLAPFIIMAVAASHTVLFIKRFLTDELREGVSHLEALRQTLIQMTKPMLVALATDLMAFVVLAFVPFDNVRVLGQVTALGLAAVVIIIPSFVVALLSFMPHGRLLAASQSAQQGREAGSGIVYRVTSGLVRPLVYRRSVQVLVLVVTAVLMFVSLSAWFPLPIPGDGPIARFFRATIETGQNNTYAVHNYLTRSWEGNQLYEMEQEIKKQFGGVYTMAILVEGAEGGSVKTPEVLRALDGLSRDLEELDEVAAVVGLPFYVKVMNRFLNADKDEYFRIPDEERAQMAINEALYFLTGGMPGAFDFVVDPEFRRSSTIAFVTDTSPKTVQKVIGRANRYLAENWKGEGLGGVEVRLPAGNVGIADAFNRSIGKWLVLATLLSAAASFVVAALILRSLAGPLLLMFPLAAGTVVWAFLVWMIGIEFNSNVTSALAIASGVGIDAEVYLLYRFREEYPRHGSFHDALFAAFTLVREPLIFSFVALFAGCLAVSIVPLYVGYVGFCMALILLTTFLLSFFVAPVLWSLIQPRFLTRGLEMAAPPGGRTSDAAAPATTEEIGVAPAGPRRRLESR